jgi:hypothetical protein
MDTLKIVECNGNEQPIELGSPTAENFIEAYEKRDKLQAKAVKAGFDLTQRRYGLRIE